MSIESSPFGPTRLTGESARRFRQQVGNLPARPKLTAKQVALLKALDAVEGGALPAEWLKVGMRRVGTALQDLGLAEWRAHLGANRRSLKLQDLHITPAGRAALASAK